MFYYVANSGSDNNAGTYNAPFQTFDAVEAALDHGDYVLLRRGDTWADTLTITKNNVIIKGYGTGAQPLIYGAVQYGASDWANEGAGVYSIGHVPVSQENYEGVWSGDYGYAMSLSLSWCEDNAGSFYYDAANGILYVHLRNEDVLDNLVCRKLAAGLQIKAHYVQVDGIEISHCMTGIGIRAIDKQPDINTCYIHHCTYYGVESSAYGSKVRHCQLDYNGLHRGGGAVTINTSTAQNGLIEYCSCAGNGGHPLFFNAETGSDDRNWGSGPQVALGADGAIVRHNTVHAAGTGLALDIGINIEGAARATVHGNVMRGGHSECISLSIAPNCVITHNDCQEYAAPQTIYRLGSGIKVLTGSTDVRIFDNIFATTNHYGDSAGLNCLFLHEDVIADRNTYYQPQHPDRIILWRDARYTLSTWQQASTQDANSSNELQ